MPLTRGLKLGYGVGQLSDGVKQAAFHTFLFFYYNQVLGLSGSLAGMAALLALVIDAITDPMVGQLSDQCRSRWGRRHPFMLAGAIPFGLAIFALFSPPEGLGEFALFAWMLGGAVAVRLSLTLFFVPHMSLGAELVSDYHGRTTLISYRVFFTYAGILFVSVMGFALFFPSPSPESNGLLNRQSYPAFGAFCAVTGTLAMLLSVFSTRSAIPSLSVAPLTPSGGHPALAFMQVLRTLKLRSFKILFIAILVFSILAGVIQTLLVHVATYVLGFESGDLAVLALSVIIGVTLAPITAQTLSRRLDKRKALALCVILGCLFAFSPQFLFFSGFLETMGSSSKLAFVFIVNGVSQVFFIAYVILIDSMLSDIVDENELHCGRREEGLFFAARAFASKASYGLGSFFAGVGLDIIQFPTGATVATVSDATVLSLAILSGPVLFVLFMATVFISNRYPMTAHSHGQIVAAIKARNLKS